MGLQSKLFTKPSQPKLEACLIRDSAHITEQTNAVGDHVSKIQAALFALGFGDNIAPSELASGTYGPTTAAAVLAFKTKPPAPRSPIINFSYQTRPDNKVGKMTIAALDEEMVKLERKLVPPPAKSILLTAGTISWIQGSPSPISGLGTQAAELSPAWIPKTYLGLAATSNGFPPLSGSSADFKALRGKRDFRAMTFCRFSIDTDEADQVTNFRVLEAFSDGGFTPPFNKSKFPAAVVGSILEGDLSLFDDVSHPGEASVLSRPAPATGIITQGRHKNTTIRDVPLNEVVLVNMLVKFRAGKRTDDIGVNVVKAPFHVPWVWCELVATFAGRGIFKVYGRGSIFPSHAWYFDGRQVGTVSETGDARFPILRGTRSLILESQLKLFPVLSAGVRAPSPQTTDLDLGGPVETQPNAAPGGRGITVSKFISG